MRTRKFALTEKEINTFRQAEQSTRDAYALKRLQGVRLYGSGESISNIQRVVNAAENTIRQWVMRYQREGIAGLSSQWQGGNANKLTPAQRADLKQRIERYTPAEVIAAEARMTQNSFWTVSDFQMVIEAWYGVVYRSQNSYYHLMRVCGLSYQKAEKIFRSQPGAVQLAEFEAELEKK